MNKYLVTGVAGFIASRVAEMLLEGGHEVVGIDNMNDYYDIKLKHYRLDRVKNNANFSFYQVDISDQGAMEVLFMHHKFDAVVNLAARAGVRYSIVNPYVYMMTNAQGTLILLEEIKKHGIKKMVLASTSSLYAGQKMPFKEDLAVNTPISTYAASKKAAEVLAHSYHQLFDLDITILRYFTVFGPAGRPDMSIYRFIRWIQEGQVIELFGDGTQSRDFTYVDDIARGTVAALNHKGYDIINLGGGRNPITINQIIEWVEDLVGKKAQIDYKPFNAADIKETWADISKAKQLLDWEPKVDVYEGIRRTIHWHIESYDWLKNTVM
jgi:UDP-glucuronate 4-epimerase